MALKCQGIMSWPTPIGVFTCVFRGRGEGDDLRRTEIVSHDNEAVIPISVTIAFTAGRTTQCVQGTDHTDRTNRSDPN